MTAVVLPSQSAERLTVPLLPPRVTRCEPSEQDIVEGVREAGYSLTSEVAGCSAHFIDLDDTWMVMPAQGFDHLTIAEARMYIRELQIALAAAERLESHKPRRISASDAAITGEVEAYIADREWTVKDAAAAFGMTETKLTSRLRGYTSWTVTDLLTVADRLTEDSEEAAELFVRVGCIGFEAWKADADVSSLAGSGRTVRRREGVDDELRALDR